MIVPPETASRINALCAITYFPDIAGRDAHVAAVGVPLMSRRSTFFSTRGFLPKGNGCSESSRLRPVGLVFLSLVEEVMSTAFSAMKILASCQSNCLLSSTCGQSQDRQKYWGFEVPPTLIAGADEVIQ